MLVGLGLLAVASLPGACDDDSGPDPKPRGYVMGFSAIPPTADESQLLATLALATQHSDAGLIQLSIPWAVLLDGTAAPVEVRTVRLPLVQYYRGRGCKIVVALDVTDGLNRGAEAPELVTLRRSITEPAVQQLYREYVSAVDTILQPEYLSLAAETNLIRLVAGDPIYSSVVAMVNAAATEQRALATTSKLMVSVQVETAWGRLQGVNIYQGVDQDRTDFPFLDALGLSSYPYLGGFATPEDIPDDYYSRLTLAAPLPVVVLEGGWPSVSVGITSSRALQADYIHRHAELLDQANAAGLFQITFTDFDLSTFPPPLDQSLAPFAHLGLVDSALGPKPALASWDSVFERPYRP
jgi:hypothetical protein